MDPLGVDILLGFVLGASWASINYLNERFPPTERVPTHFLRATLPITIGLLTVAVVLAVLSPSWIVLTYIAATWLLFGITQLWAAWHRRGERSR